MMEDGGVIEGEEEGGRENGGGGREGEGEREKKGVGWKPRRGNPMFVRLRSVLFDRTDKIHQN